jgi:hypothetical protein
MAPPNRPLHIVLAHELDVAWIIALWLAFHDGDPVPEGISKATQSEQAEVLVRRVAHISRGPYLPSVGRCGAFRHESPTHCPVRKVEKRREPRRDFRRGRQPGGWPGRQL